MYWTPGFSDSSTNNNAVRRQARWGCPQRCTPWPHVAVISRSMSRAAGSTLAPPTACCSHNSRYPSQDAIAIEYSPNSWSCSPCATNEPAEQARTHAAAAIPGSAALNGIFRDLTSGMTCDVIDIIEASDPAMRDSAIDHWCAGKSHAHLLAACDARCGFRRRERNFYRRVRGLFLIAAIHRCQLPGRADLPRAGRVPYHGLQHLLERRFEEAIAM